MQTSEDYGHEMKMYLRLRQRVLLNCARQWRSSFTFSTLGNSIPTIILPLSMHCNENPIYVLLFWELRCLSPNFHIHVSMSDLYIPRIGSHISFSRIARSIVGILNRSQTQECGNLDSGRTISFLGIFVPNFLYWFFAVWFIQGILQLTTHLEIVSFHSVLCEISLCVDHVLYIP
jgi:hypothetical protein